jgi:hypothetical protein
MTNTQFGFRVAVTSGSPYGISIDFTVPTGIPTIAAKAGNFCTGGNLLAFDNSNPVNYVECSITYAYSIPGVSRGWYFWAGYTGASKAYLALSADPTGHSVTVRLLYNGNNWEADLTDHNNSSNNTSYGFSSTIAGYVIPSGQMFFEDGGDTNCCDYSTFGGMTFSNLKFYNQSGGTISCGYTVGKYNQNPPSSNCANTSSTCINETINSSTYVLSTNG